METITRIGWLLLAAVHAMPAAVLFAPRLLQPLYGVEPGAVPGLLLVHRGLLFAALVVACGFALFDPSARRLASTLLALSVLGFLVIYARAGAPPGALRTVALVDLAALVPLAWVLVTAWMPRASA